MSSPPPMAPPPLPPLPSLPRKPGAGDATAPKEGAAAAVNNKSSAISSPPLPPRPPLPPKAPTLPPLPPMPAAPPPRAAPAVPAASSSSRPPLPPLPPLPKARVKSSEATDDDAPAATTGASPEGELPSLPTMPPPPPPAAAPPSIAKANNVAQRQVPPPPPPKSGSVNGKVDGAASAASSSYSPPPPPPPPAAAKAPPRKLDLAEAQQPGAVSSSSSSAAPRSAPSRGAPTAARSSRSSVDVVASAEVLAVAVDAALVGGAMLAQGGSYSCSENAEEEGVEGASFSQEEGGLLARIQRVLDEGMQGLSYSSAASGSKWCWHVAVPTLENERTGIGALIDASVAITASVVGKPRVCVVYDVARDELFTAVQGRGAELNGNALQVSADKVALSDAIIAAEPTREREFAQPCLQALMAMSPPTARDVVITGSAVLSLAWVACGRLDGFYSLGLSGCARSAGLLLVQEAGGHLTDCSGEQQALSATGDAVDVCVTGGDAQLHEALLEVIRSTAAAEP
eukprot:TRINITY_DN27469_c0_g1_i1.p1 TRINITY_DN27469_c0_g1~~TRINITY_DN27469_c0_g1_i1.p1  ORF type:complete len:514 (+),score=126.25 TRINITY_DN27469_c0_g1_i1:179-1720(+)